jgi:DNA-binding transcriptional MerR regulator
MAKSMLRIGEIARLLGVTPKTVRHYHKLGLIPEPKRSEADYRLYTPQDLFHLRRIRRLQSIGLSLQQIKFILDADDPDALLQTTLQGLQNELAAQQARIEERRQRIERYLSEGVSLKEVEQPDVPSPTYQLLADKLGDLVDLPDSLIQFDQQVFGQLDAFEWGDDFNAGWQNAAGYFANNAEEYAALGEMVEKLVALQDLSADDPQIKQWAEKTKQSGVFNAIAASTATFDQIDPQLNEVMGHILMQNFSEHLSPAQQRFFELLIS